MQVSNLCFAFGQVRYREVLRDGRIGFKPELADPGLTEARYGLWELDASLPADRQAASEIPGIFDIKI